MPLPSTLGSAYQRKSDGRWCACITLGKRRIVRYATTEREAKRLLQQMIRDNHLGTLAAPTRATVAEWVAKWLDQMGQDLRPSSLRTYRQTLEPLSGLLGHHRLDHLTAATVADAFSTLRQQGRGARRLQLGYGYLKACFDHAVKLDVIAVNPLGRVPRPKWVPQERRYWTTTEAAAFIRVATASKYRWAPLLVLLTSCGMRVSEALGLTWADVDLRAGTLRIERALVWSGGVYVLGAPKTRAGRRVIGLPAVALEALRRLPRPISDDSRIFRTTTSTAPHPDRLRRTMVQLCAQAGIERLNIHGLRHVAAMLALQATHDPHATARRLGHADVGVTMRIYGYDGSRDSDVATAIDALISANAAHEASQRA